MLEVDLQIITLWTAFVLGCFHSLEYVLPRLSRRFEKMTFGRRRYVIKNIVKSGLITFLAVTGASEMINFFIRSETNNTFIHTYGLMYAIPDVYAIWWLGKCCPGYMASSTVYHHVTVGVLAIISLLHDFSVESHWNAMLMYAYLSMLTGVVNFYLGIRFVLNRNDDREDQIRCAIAKFALLVYVGCSAVNWLYQLHIVMLWLDFRWAQLFWTSFAGVLVYCGMLALIIKDDLELMANLTEASKPYNKPADVTECAKHFVGILMGGATETEGLILSIRDGGRMIVSTSKHATVDLGELSKQISHFRSPYKVEAHDLKQYTISLVE
jgi:hypothetical protein